MLRRWIFCDSPELAFRGEFNVMTIGAEDCIFHLYLIRFRVNPNRYDGEEVKLFQSETLMAGWRHSIIGA